MDAANDKRRQMIIIMNEIQMFLKVVQRSHCVLDARQNETHIGRYSNYFQMIAEIPISHLVLYKRFVN